MKTIAYQQWEESESDWGCRPDGFSLHLSLEDYQRYLKKYWDRMPKSVLHEYSRPTDAFLAKEGNVIEIQIDGRSALYRQLKEARRKRHYGIRYWQHGSRPPEMKKINKQIKGKCSWEPIFV